MSITFHLQSAADYVRTSHAPKMLVTILNSVYRIFTFTQERKNRLARFVRVVRAYSQGQSVADIVTQYGCSKQTVLRYARMTGLPKRPKGFAPEVRRATIALYKSGAPISQIQAQLGVSQAYVSKVATEEGINRRDFAKKRAR